LYSKSDALSSTDFEQGLEHGPEKWAPVLDKTMRRRNI